VRQCHRVPGRISAGLLTAICVCFAGASAAQTTSDAQRRASYASLADLPDWSGWWLGAIAATPASQLASQPPSYTPEAARARSESLAENAPAPMLYCRPREFTGETGGFTEGLEFLFTPGRVTMTTERGLLRRIYTDGRPMPEKLEYTNTGTSIGHWEGDTLVIETKGIDPAIYFPERGPGGVPFGEGVVINERVHLADGGMLRIDVETIAPDIFSAPYRFSQFYARLDKTMGNEISWCFDDDRSLDPSTGEQRFDVTPPRGLPPPPPTP